MVQKNNKLIDLNSLIAYFFRPLHSYTIIDLINYVNFGIHSSKRCNK